MTSEEIRSDRVYERPFGRLFEDFEAGDAAFADARR